MRRAALAALLLAATGAPACWRRASSPTFTVGAEATRPAPALAGPALRVLHLADFGDETPQQAAVARSVAAAHRRAPFDLALFPGDNLYGCGPDVEVAGAAACRFAPDGNTVAPGFSPPADRTFLRHERPLAPLAGAGAPAVPVYLTLGNHDVGAGAACSGEGRPTEIARLRACLEVAHASPLWTMPGRHWVLDRGPARFIGVDSNLITGDYGGFQLADEVAFVASAAEGCDRRTCFLVGHHPPATAGDHRGEADKAGYAARMGALLDAGHGRIRAWLGGHDHDLQHLRTAAGLDVLVSGNGARGRAEERFDRASGAGTKLLFGSVRWGFGVLEVAPAGWRYRFEDVDGAPLHCCVAEGAGPCEPVACW
ncbi:MAG TPA: metallophosphoesterase [Anaeromyxobacter sp.]|nr:metallophosphoesterase [Anaeromyxobacter sp.]